jgi:ParB family transcriptional regulator, chromosome partitioning protein
VPSNPSQPAIRANQPARGLGRGLGALIPGAGGKGEVSGSGEEQGALAPGVLMVPVDDIMPNPRQPRAAIPAEALAGLADSIRQHGVIQPLIITRSRPTDPAPYHLIAGERRWRAARLAGLESVPALLKDTTPQESLELALVENIQRADLNALEEAHAYQALVDDFGLTQEAVAERVGRSRVAVANTLRLLRLPDAVKEMLVAGSLTEGHARALLGLPNSSAIEKLAREVCERGLTVRQTEELVRRVLAAVEARPEDADHEEAAEAADPHTRQLEQAFRGALGTKVSLMRGRRGGKLVIHFYSDEELQSIYEQIVGAS